MNKNEVKDILWETEYKKRLLVAETEIEWLKRSLSDIEDWCVEFHETGPHDPEKALKIVMTIYDIAHEHFQGEYIKRILPIESAFDDLLKTNHWLEDELDIYRQALKSACKALEGTKADWTTPGGNSLEDTFLRQAKWEVEND